MLGKIKGGIGLIVVSDTTPLISLMKIGQLDLVNQLFGEVQIPNAVYEELVTNTRFPDESRRFWRHTRKNCCLKVTKGKYQEVYKPAG